MLIFLVVYIYPFAHITSILYTYALILLVFHIPIRTHYYSLKFLYKELLPLKRQQYQKVILIERGTIS